MSNALINRDACSRRLRRATSYSERRVARCLLLNVCAVRASRTIKKIWEESCLSKAWKLNSVRGSGKNASSWCARGTKLPETRTTDLYYLQDRCIIMSTLCLRPSSCFLRPSLCRINFSNHFREISHACLPREVETASRAHRRSAWRSFRDEGLTARVWWELYLSRKDARVFLDARQGRKGEEEATLSERLVARPQRLTLIFTGVGVLEGHSWNGSCGLQFSLIHPILSIRASHRIVLFSSSLPGTSPRVLLSLLSVPRPRSLALIRLFFLSCWGTSI